MTMIKANLLHLGLNIGTEAGACDSLACDSAEWATIVTHMHERGLNMAVIELAIAVNLCIPYYLGTELPFVGPILISTIQLGATVDYAILMTTRYKQHRLSGTDRKESVEKAVSSAAQSILVSGLGFFAATYGVGLYSNVDIISSMCRLIARGALLSVAVVLFLLPAMLLLLDKVIVRTTLDMKSLR